MTIKQALKTMIHAFLSGEAADLLQAKWERDRWLPDVLYWTIALLVADVAKKLGYR